MKDRERRSDFDSAEVGSSAFEDSDDDQASEEVLAGLVYAGSGLRGYGNLLIIKHNATYFSAYAHSRRLLVSEGAQVKVGEKIAEVGSTGTDRTKLHFEIRKDGNPVNPLKYLPR